MTAAVAYLRISTQEQTNGLGLDVQTERITAWAEATGRTIVSWRFDAGKSGSNGLDDRIGLADALNDLATEGGPVELVVASLDRLARDLILQELLLRQVRDLDAEIRSCEPTEDANLMLGTEDTDPARTLIRQVLGALAEYERKVIRLRLVRGRRLKLRNGGYGGGPIGFGSKVGLYGFEPDPATWPTLERIGAERKAGRMYQAIANDLTAEKVEGPTGTYWHAQTVRRCYLRWANMTDTKPIKRGTFTPH